MKAVKIIKEVTYINEGKTQTGDILIKNDRFEKIDTTSSYKGNYDEIDGSGLHLFPGIIDDQVHFREPGLTHKASIATEAKAAVAGGVTSFMEMPNTNPPALTQELLEEKYNIASKTSLANYSFFIGASNDNLNEVLKTNPNNVCGIKVFMGSSTGNMLVDNEKVLESIFQQSPMLIATHCESEERIRKRTQQFKSNYPNGTAILHPQIRDAEACLLSSQLAVELAKKYNTRLHILHISTAIETHLFDNQTPLSQKRITSEACVHHLTLCDEDYPRLGNLIKCNPAIKTSEDRAAIRTAVLENRIDIIATDHAPHTWEEKSKPYFDAPSGLPLVQHSLQLMLKNVEDGWITLQQMIEKMCHAPAICFHIKERGFLREGYFADAVLVNLQQPETVQKSNLHYKCGWSPFEGQTFNSSIISTFVNGNRVFHLGEFDEEHKGKRLEF